MITGIVTDLLIIDYLISVSLTLSYLPLVFRHLNFLPYNLLPNVVSKNMMWQTVDPDETPHLQHLIWVYNVCSGLSDQIHTVKYNIW